MEGLEKTVFTSMDKSFRFHVEDTVVSMKISSVKDYDKWKALEEAFNDFSERVEKIMES